MVTHHFYTDFYEANILSMFLTAEIRDGERSREGHFGPRKSIFDACMGRVSISLLFQSVSAETPSDRS